MLDRPEQSTPKLPESSKLTLVRIKRKRHESCLEYGNDDDDDDAAAATATVVLDNLSNKRQKDVAENYESTDPLKEGETGTNARRPSLFKFAETFTKSDFDDYQKRRMLEIRLSKLAKSKRDDNGPAEESDEVTPAKKDEQPARYRIVRGKRGIGSLSDQEGNQEHSTGEAKRIKSRDAKPDAPATPPNTELQFEFFDAIKEDSTKKFDVDLKAMEDDDLMSHFVPMLKSHLKISESEKSLETSDDEYVYDIYYVDEESANLRNILRKQANIGYFLWDEDYEDDGVLPDDFGSSDEYNDDAEDSNAEDYYANSYPDESDYEFDSDYGNHEKDHEYDDYMW
ncbi:hypothetical protein H4219_002202 [Mycoemilia scoparia]|uniref:Probable RNA polymerase II nuclear localization protein SLC7A6OS n=1 Tax=Mycoemilia scoparia TaxID=417184 RepID=A0A9W8A654_9FUNG|nr:hypothetical protein H4219_002202 [Mycoemilia scoparia]